MAGPGVLAFGGSRVAARPASPTCSA